MRSLGLVSGGLDLGSLAWADSGRIALGILASYGANAHLYLPGVGNINGIAAGNYLDSAGTTAATVDNPVGLSLDALQAMTLGPELVTNGTNPVTTTGWTPTNVAVDAVSSELRITKSGSNGWGSQLLNVTIGKTYTLTATARKGTANLAYLRVSSGANGVSPYGADAYTSSTTNVPLTVTFVASATTVYVNLGGQDLDGTVFYNNISVREIPGIHATQATTVNKPILRRSGGKYSWQFDGINDSLRLSAPLFQMSDDHAVIVGCSPAVSSLSAGVVSQTGTNAYVPNLGFLSGSPYAYWRDDALTVENLGGTSVSVGSAVVLTAVKISNAKRLRQNGVQKASGSVVMGASTITSQGIGQGGSFWNGSIYPVIAIKGTVSDSDLLTLERFVGQLSGVSI